MNRAGCRRRQNLALSGRLPHSETGGRVPQDAESDRTRVIWSTVRSLLLAPASFPMSTRSERALAVQFDEANPRRVIALRGYSDTPGSTRLSSTFAGRTRRRLWGRSGRSRGALGTPPFRPQRSPLEESPRFQRLSGGGAYGIRTRVTAVRGRRPRPLDECALRRSMLPTALPGLQPPDRDRLDTVWTSPLLASTT